MRKYFKEIFVGCFILIPQYILSQQSLIDFYRMDYVLPPLFTGSVPNYTNLSNQLVYDSELPISGSGYDGEYMLAIREHPLSMPFVRNNHWLSYKIEVVSFPFTVNCWNNSGCSDNQLERKLTMPDEPYNDVMKGWGYGSNSAYYLKNIRENGQFFQSPLYGAYFSGADDHPEALVTTTYLSNSVFIGSNWRHNFPHTVLKHKIFIHCDDNPSSAVIDSIEWIYDNTRGRMRNYPFANDNLPALAPSRYDVVFSPQIIVKPQADHSFMETSNETWFDGGTINYNEHSPNYYLNTCPNALTSGYATEFPSDVFREYSPSTQSYITYFADAPPQSLLSAYLRSANFQLPVGYKKLGSDMWIDPAYLGISHQYFINTGYPDIDLEKINISEKIIFNPSSAIVDPNLGNLTSNNPPITLIFPENYIFKTVLGRYPSLQEVIDASSDPQNDPKSNYDESVVPVDANTRPHSPGTQPYDYPELTWDNPLTIDPSGFLLDERFGYYIINKNATILVENCVKIYDARFLVNKGGTLQFNDYTQILGYEDKSSNLGRYKIKGNGGAILRNFNNEQYVQNGDITQSNKLEYIARNVIFSGENVDPDLDQPIGTYVIQNGADVEFWAGNGIKLSNGFGVQYGGNFHAQIHSNLPSFPICNSNAYSNQNNRINSQTSLQIQNVQRVIANPNPNDGSFEISLLNKQIILNVWLFDLTGRTIAYYNDIGSINKKIELMFKRSGLYSVKVEDLNGNIVFGKVVIY